MKTFMFHYVNNNFNYYHFDSELFDKTIKYLSDNYKIISLKEYDEIKKNNQELDDSYVMLTFDDGTIDHYKYVFPVLKKYYCSGLFFIPSCIFNNQVLDIQIIHQLIAKGNIKYMLEELLKEIKTNKLNIDLDNLISTYDNNDMALFKQLLQYKLPKNLRNKMLLKFSNKYSVSLDASDYYINLRQLKKMKNNNMFFGIHTNTHPRLEFLSKEEQHKEIEENMKLLIDNQLIDFDLCSIAYPFGSYNEDTLEILKEMNIKYGFKINSNNSINDLLIDRIDCKKLKEDMYEKIY